MSARRRLWGTAAVVLGLLALATALELSLRADDGLPSEPARIQGWKTWRDVVHRRSTVPGLRYELTGDLEVELFWGWGVEISAAGLRDEEPETERNVFRVAVLGGAFAFGWGARREEQWTTLLERSLDRSMLVSGRAADVVDLGVSGYTAAEMAVVLEERALALDPWIVVLELDLADSDDLPVRLLERRYGESRAWGGLRLLELLRGSAHDTAMARTGPDALSDVDGSAWRTLREAFERVRTLCAPRGIPVVLVLVPRTGPEPWSQYPHRTLHARLTEEGVRNDFAVLDLLADFEREPPDSLVLAPHDLRPNARAQAIAAESVKRFLYTSGVLTLVLESH